MPYTSFKRLNNEIENIMNYYTDKKEPNFEIDVKYKLTTIELRLPNEITILLPKHYPFHPPEVFIKNKDYKRSLQCSSKKITYYLKQRNINCLCCSTVLCDNIWSPIYTIVKIIDEVLITKNIKKRVGYELALDELTHKKGLPEIMKQEILQFL